MFWLFAGLAAGAALLGGAVKAKAASEESRAKEAAAREEALQVRKETEWKVGDLQLQQKQYAGQVTARIGASGVKISSGSPLALQAENARRMTQDVERLRQQGEWEAEHLEAEADIYRRTRPYQVGGSLLGGLASAAGILSGGF